MLIRLTLSGFWCEVLGDQVQRHRRASHLGPGRGGLRGAGRPAPRSLSARPEDGGTGPRLFVQRVPEGKTAKNRVHLDVRDAPGAEGDERMTALVAEASRLVRLGAMRVRRMDPDGRMETGFALMVDPEATSSVWTERR